MKKEILFKIATFLFLISFLGCKNSDNTFVATDASFNEYINLFQVQDLPVLVDSTVFDNLANSELDKLNEEQLSKYLDTPFSKEKCGPKSKWIIQPLYKISINKEQLGLLYFIKLNSNCGYEVYIRKLGLGIYDVKGSLIEYKEIGNQEIHWGMYKGVHVSIESDLTVKQKNVKIIESYNGEVNKEESTSSFKIIEE